jgi:hypothetical protein
MTQRSSIVVMKGLCLLWTLLVLQGCPSKPPSGVLFPITSGSHVSLPAPDQHILIWADPPLADVAFEWLRLHHYVHLLMPQKAPLQAHQIAHDSSTRKAALALAQETHAGFVLVLERKLTKDGALLEPHCGSRYDVSVELQGVLVASGETALRGRAHYPQCVDLDDKTLRSLTCQAFATAWGFRPPGQLEIPSSLMCTTGETAPAPLR